MQKIIVMLALVLSYQTSKTETSIAQKGNLVSENEATTVSSIVQTEDNQQTEFDTHEVTQPSQDRFQISLIGNW